MLSAVQELKQKNNLLMSSPSSKCAELEIVMISGCQWWGLWGTLPVSVVSVQLQLGQTSLSV